MRSVYSISHIVLYMSALMDGGGGRITHALARVGGMSDGCAVSMPADGSAWIDGVPIVAEKTIITYVYFASLLTGHDEAQSDVMHASERGRCNGRSSGKWVARHEFTAVKYAAPKESCQSRRTQRVNESSTTPSLPLQRQRECSSIYHHTYFPQRAGKSRC